MATTLKFSLLILFSFSYASILAAAATTTTATAINSKAYVKGECSKVTFKTFCYKTMRSHSGNIGNNPKTLTLVGLEIALNWTMKAQTYVIGFSKMPLLKHIDYVALDACFQSLSSSAGNLSASLTRLEDLGPRGTRGFSRNAESDLTGMINNALTNSESCKDEMADTNLHNDVRVSIKARMQSVTMLLGNSMAFATSFIDSN